MDKVIGVISLKGGVGKTSSTIALGSALSELGKKVLLIDGNFTSPHLGAHVGLNNPDLTLQHVLNGQANMDDAVYDTGYGFDMIPGGVIGGKINPFKLFDKLRDIRRKYDVILIDSSPNLNEEMLATIIASDELLVVTTPDLVTLSSTVRAIKLAKDRKTHISGIILNKVYGKDFEVNIDQIEEAAGTSVLAVLPHEICALESLAQKTPWTMNKKSKAAIEYKKLAAALVGEKYPETKFESFMKNWFGKALKQDINRDIFRENALKKY